MEDMALHACIKSWLFVEAWFHLNVIPIFVASLPKVDDSHLQQSPPTLHLGFSHVI